MIELRDYQEAIINGLRKEILQGKKRLVMSAPTGGGKTVMFSFMVKKHIEKGGQVLVFTHRKELLKQAGGTFQKFDLKPELIVAGSQANLHNPLHVAMIETFNKRIEALKPFLTTRTLIIIDECHLASFDKLFPFISNNSIVIGATATSYRRGKEVTALEEMYEGIVQTVDTPELIKKGFLSPAKSYGVQIDLSEVKKKGEDYDMKDYYEEHKTYKGVVENYLRICPNTKALLFASNVDSSKKVCEEFNQQGIKARHIDGGTSKKEREEVLEWFDNTPNAVVCNCGILNAGFDQPDIETVILYRATASLPLFLQMCGRGSRIAPNKTHFNILDFGNNIKRLGFWEDFREWSLKKDVKRQSKEDAMRTKDCPKCGAIMPPKTKVCAYCKHEFKKTEEDEVDELIAHLEEMKPFEVNRFALNSDLITKVRLCKAKKINPYFVLHKTTDINEAREFIRLMGWEEGFEEVNKDRFEVFRNG